VDLFSSCITLDTLTSDAFLADALGVALPPPAAPQPPSDEWTANFARALQIQHTRVREFLQSRRDRWRRISAQFTCQVEKLQAEVHALTVINESLRAGRGATVVVSRPYAQDPAATPGQGGDWETQKKRLLAELESDDPLDADSAERRLTIEEIIARTDRIIADKDHEIEELQHLLDTQSNSLGSLALGAAAVEQVFNQDEIIREERQRLKLLQEELREKLCRAEVEHATERARLARREAEIEEKLRAGESRRAAAAADVEALAPTGRPVRGRWRTQMGLTDDGPPDFERERV
jgi:hypothetical protein